ncbi:MAG: NAD-dependent epimerase/dehydratase family protein [Planctomycetes bacterium]|nr:NAD-dependent epimerase/dehydratase family protein [Planctomycetota bacterium]
MPNEKLLVTGATGMVGSFVARRAIDLGYNVRLLVRPNSDRTLLEGVDAEYVEGDLGDYDSLPAALAGVDIVVHSGAHIGDWGPAEKYRAINVVGLEHMLTVVEHEERLKRWIQVSSLGVYPARHHYGTDETTPPDLTGLDGYTRTKAEAEVLVNQHIGRFSLPAVIVRPGFIYGPGERHVIPRLIQKFESGVVKFIGDPKKVLNNTHVSNLVDAIFLAIDSEKALGQTYNIRDERLVTREEYLMTFADYLGKPRPARVPLWLATTAAPVMEGFAKLRGATQPPLLTKAAIKFMALNLDFSIEKAKRELGYQPQVDFQDGMREALDWATGKRPAALRGTGAHANR